MIAAQRVTAIPRSGIRSVLERAGDPGIINLAAGEPDFDTPPHITRAAVEAMSGGATHYTHGRGLPELREAYVAKLAAENELTGYRPDRHVVVTAGALNALAATFLAVVNPGDRVLVPDPGFANYAAQIQLAEGVPVAIPFPHELGFQPDFERLEQLAKTASVLIVNSPANPTGVTLSPDVLSRIADIAERQNLLVIADEAYEHLIYGDSQHRSFAALPGMRKRTLTVHSMSKSWAMTGWRIGFVAGPEPLIAEIAKAQEHLIGCPPAMTQWGAVAALTGPIDSRQEMVRRYTQRRALVLEAFALIPEVELVVPDGSFYVFPRFAYPERGNDLAQRIADTAGVLAVPGSAFGSGSGQHLRFSYAGPEARLQIGLERLVDSFRLTPAESGAHKIGEQQ